MKWLIVGVGIITFVFFLTKFSLDSVSVGSARRGMGAAYDLGKLNYRKAMNKHADDVALGIYPAFNIHVVDRLVDSMEKALPELYGELVITK